MPPTSLNHVASRVNALADATGLARLGGSDAHTTRGIGRTWVEAPQATCRALAAAPFVLEARFNRRLLVDLVARPSARPPHRAALSSRPHRLAAEGVSA